MRSGGPAFGLLWMLRDRVGPGACQMLKSCERSSRAVVPSMIRLAVPETA